MYLCTFSWTASLACITRVTGFWDTMHILLCTASCHACTSTAMIRLICLLSTVPLWFLTALEGFPSIKLWSVYAYKLFYLCGVNAYFLLHGSKVSRSMEVNEIYEIEFDDFLRLPVWGFCKCASFFGLYFCFDEYYNRSFLPYYETTSIFRITLFLLKQYFSSRENCFSFLKRYAIFLFHVFNAFGNILMQDNNHNFFLIKWEIQHFPVSVMCLSNVSKQLLNNYCFEHCVLLYL